jgi:hypothetical protein
MNSVKKLSLNIARQSAKNRRLSKKRLMALMNQIAVAAMYNALPAHLRSPKKNKSSK